VGLFRKRARENNSEHGFRIRRTLHKNFASMILNNLLDDREPQAGAIFFAVTHKGMEQPVADRFRHAGSIVGDSDGNGAPVVGDGYFNSSTRCGRRLAGIEYEVIQRALELARVKPSYTGSDEANVDQSPVMAGIQPHSLHRMLHGL